MPEIEHVGMNLAAARAALAFRRDPAPAASAVGRAGFDRAGQLAPTRLVLATVAARGGWSAHAAWDGDHPGGLGG
ncbi:MAG: hypothetical protein ACREFZ_09835, partial [Acetobacteraceae bacterium]